jgi:inner membrane protein
MPGGKTHLAIGVGVGLALGSRLPLDNTFPVMLGLTVVLCSVAALTPDLDIDDNELEETTRDQGRNLSRWMRNTARDSDSLDKIAARGVGATLSALGEITSRLVEGLSWLVQRVTTHRGLTHSVLALAVTTGLASAAMGAWFGSVWWGAVWGAGYASHLISDAWTWSGVRFLLPFTQRRFWLAPRFLRFRVGTWRDTVLRIVSPFAGLAILLWQSPIIAQFRSVFNEA